VQRVMASVHEALGVRMEGQIRAGMRAIIDRNLRKGVYSEIRGAVASVASL
jgi:hypothetical protein